MSKIELLLNWSVQNAWMNQWADLQTSVVYKVCLFILSFFYTAVRRLSLSSQQHKAYDHVRSWRLSEWVRCEKVRINDEFKTLFIIWLNK